MFHSYQIEQALRQSPELLVNQQLWGSWDPNMLATSGTFVGLLAAAAIWGRQKKRWDWNVAHVSYEP